jgi:hypothetical protein
MSENYYKSTLCNNPEEWRSHLHCDGSLKPHSWSKSLTTIPAGLYNWYISNTFEYFPCSLLLSHFHHNVPKSTCVSWHMFRTRGHSTEGQTGTCPGSKICSDHLFFGAPVCLLPFYQHNTTTPLSVPAAVPFAGTVSDAYNCAGRNIWQQNPPPPTLCLTSLCNRHVLSAPQPSSVIILYILICV